MNTDKNDRSYSDKTPTSPLAARDRRDFMIQSSALVGASALLVSGLSGSGFAAAVEPVEEFQLPELPYAYDALDQVIDQETMTIHHTKHHQAYINKLNEAVKSHQELAGRSVEDLIRNVESLPESARMAIRNHGGGHHNHSLFWQVMRPAQENNAPKGQFAEQLNSSFGSFEKFKEAFTKNALDQFGSGWSWLVVSKSQLELMKTPNQDSPLMAGKQPLLGIDVWEHAYYLKYQNRRPDYVAAWWQVVNWDAVASKLQA